MRQRQVLYGNPLPGQEQTTLPGIPLPFSSISKRLPLYGEALLRLIYPASCALCRRTLPLSKRWLCRPCRQKLKRLELPRTEARKAFALGLVREYLFLYAYKEEFKDFWSQIKFGRRAWLAAALRGPLEKFLLAVGPQTRYDYLIPVPTTLWRRLKRHYNQAEILARLFSVLSGIPVLKALKKNPFTPAQRGLARKERLQNLRGSLKAGFGEKLRGRSVLIIDDVYTTGATAHESARAMKKAGVKTVGVFALARTPALKKQKGL